MAAVKVLGQFYFSRLLGNPVYDATGAKVGRIKDMAMRWEGGHPQITGIKYKSKVHNLIPLEQVASCDEQAVRLTGDFSAAQTRPLRTDDIYVSKWLLDKQIIDLQGSKIVRVNDITLSWIEPEEVPGVRHMMLMAVDIGVRGLFRRLGVEFMVRRVKENLLGWQYFSPLESWNSSLQIVRDRQQLKDLHPADIADMVEEMGYKYRAEFMSNLEAQQAVDALAEMDLETQVDIIEQMDKDRASDLLEEMPADEAADILGELSVDKSEELLELMEEEDAEDVRELMRYEEGTAGALMTTEYIGLPSSLTVEQTIVRLRELAPAAETIYYLYVVDDAERLLGVLSLRELIIAAPDKPLGELMHTKVASVRDDDDYETLAEVVNKYGLLAVPVVDADNVMRGIVTVDDVLDQMLPERSEMMNINYWSVKRPGRGRVQ
ncbi:MAG TPA: CBS domain-containing protein [Patescibacteria group bacterium]|nr:CBS domain-containing protein [Patescibacteria group bacterium]